MQPTPLRFVPAAFGVAVVVLVLVSFVPGVAALSETGGAHGSSTVAGTPLTSGAPKAGRSRLDPTTDASPAAGVLTSTGQTPAAISLNWTDATTGTFTNYSLEEASAASGWSLAPIATITNAADTSADIRGIGPSTDYDWQVVENYETCVLGGIGCTAKSVTTNLLNLSQPAVAFLNYTDFTSTSVVMEWTNNATYGWQLSFDQYQLYEEVNGGPAALAAPAFTSATETSASIALTSGDSYTFYLETTDCAPDCSSADESVTQSNLVTLGPPETLSVSVTAEHGTIDLGQSDLFTCTPSGGESPFSYNWSVEGGPYAPGAASETFTLNTTGSQSVECQVSDGIPPAESGGTSVLVMSPLTAVATVNRTSVDAGQAVAFTCYGVGGDPAYTLQWSFGDGETSLVANLTHVYSAAGNYTPSCLVIDGTGASEAPSFMLGVSPLLTASATASSDDAAPGTSLTFTAHAANGSGSYSDFSWTFGGGGTASGSQVTHAFSGSGSPTAVLIVTDSNGASASATVDLDISDVSVTTSAPTTATAGSSVTFLASATGGAGGPYNYTWSFGDGAVAYGAQVSHAFSSHGTYTPHLTVSDRLGATNETTLAPVAVAAAPAPLSGFSVWLILGIGIAVAAILGALVLARRRSDEAKELAASSAYVPPTNPSRTIKGRKVCPSCGASNLPIRTTCQSCGKPLPRGSS